MVPAHKGPQNVSQLVPSHGDACGAGTGDRGQPTFPNRGGGGGGGQVRPCLGDPAEALQAVSLALRRVIARLSHLEEMSQRWTKD